MSVDGTKLLFEGFLQKRKDSLKLWWVTYWFRLQNTTLFFYTEKNGNASHLKGYYYIYTVQSVREVQKAERKRFVFEITMTNGRRKVLAAETAALRQEWVGQLWRAMRLSSSWVSDSSDKNLAVDEQQARLHSSSPVSSDGDSVAELRPARPFSTPAPSAHVKPPPARHDTSPVCLPDEADCEVGIYQNTFSQLKSDGDCPWDHQWSSGVNNTASGPEADYDVLPLRKQVCAPQPSTEAQEDIYDVPQTCVRSIEHQASSMAEPTESIYDVPSSLLRKNSVHTLVADEEPKGETYWRF